MLLPAIVAMCGVQAQQIDGYRYWFDDDVSTVVTTSVSATDELILGADWPTGNMAPGFHFVSYQVRDTDGIWSVPQTRHFTRGNHALTGYRFWVNDNVSAITTGTLGPNMEVELNSLIDPGNLPRDFNTVTIQFRDGDSAWSVPMTRNFVKNTGEVNGYAYWIDDDIANSYTSTIGPDDVVDLIADLPTSLPTGAHLFTIRFSGTNGTWSVPLTTSFDSFVDVPELPGTSELLLFPNPVNDMLGVRLSTTEAKQLDLHLLDAQGRVIRSLSAWSVSGTDHRNWDISDLAAGSYLLRISDGGGVANLPFVKP